MKKTLFIFLLLYGLSNVCFGQLVFKNTSENVLIIVTSDGRMGVGTSSPHTSAVLEIKSSEKGMLLPKMTTVERNAISTPANGLVIYNTSIKKLQVYTSSSGWKTL